MSPAGTETDHVLCDQQQISGPKRSVLSGVYLCHKSHGSVHFQVLEEGGTTLSLFQRHAQMFAPHIILHRKGLEIHWHGSTDKNIIIFKTQTFHMQSEGISVDNRCGRHSQSEEEDGREQPSR